MVEDISTRQRLLNLAGCGPLVVDGIRGSKTKAAEQKWKVEQTRVLQEFPTLDSRSEKNALTLLPNFQRITRSWMKQRALPAAESLGVRVKIICGTRDFAEQQRLYNQGRTTPGARVTNARPGTSFHNYGVAFDIGLFDPQGRYITSDTTYRAFFAWAGVPPMCVWGGTFKSFKDYPHIQFIGAGETIAEIKRNSEQ